MNTAEDRPSERIAVIAMTCRVPGAGDVDTFWANLLDGVESIERLERTQFDPPGYVPVTGRLDGVPDFDAAFFGMTPREARQTDPQQRLFLEQCLIALEKAGYDPAVAEPRIGVWGGSGANAYLLRNVLPGDYPGGLPDDYPASLLHGNDKDYLTSRVAYKLGLTGPAVTVQTACSTSLVAVAQAAQALSEHHCDMALAGGVSLRLPQDRGYVYETGGIQSADGRCRAFDADATGTVFTSGVGVVVLKRLVDAVADGDRVHGVILGSAVNSDGARKVGFPAPSVAGQTEVIAAAYRAAQVSPATVGYVEAHGTGTAVGDPIELAALDEVFAEAGAPAGSVGIGSVKTNLGHLNAAAGVIGLIKAVLAVRDADLPATLHYRRRNPAVADKSPFTVVDRRRPWPPSAAPRRAGVSSFGVGGTNVHVVVEEPPAFPERTPPLRPVRVLPLSARTPAALAAARAALSATLESAEPADLPHVAHTLQLGRRQFDHRIAVVAAEPAEAVTALATAAAVPARPGPVGFLLPGQGTQYSGMAAGLLTTEPDFAVHLRDCADIAAPLLGLDLTELLATPCPAGVADPLTGTALAQPALFTVEYALAQWWRTLGLEPAGLLGHSVGEWVAACLAGVFSLGDAMRLVIARGRLMGEAPRGAMLAVEMPEAEAEALAPFGVEVAAVNAADRCTVSGPAEAIERVRVLLTERGVEAQRLVTSHGFHSGAMDPVVAPFTELVARVPAYAPRIPFLSNVTGTWITAPEAVDPAYWGRQIRARVRFADGVARLAERCPGVLVEAGPGRTLSRLAGRTLGPATALVASLPGATRAGTATRVLSAALGAAWCAGAEVDWAAYADAETLVRVELPTYPFQRERHWVDAPGERAPEPAAVTILSEEPAGPAPADSDPAGGGHNDEVITRIAVLWCEALGVAAVLPDDDLFVLGGDSLLATKLMTRAGHLYGVELPLAGFLVDPTPRTMAALIQDVRANSDREVNDQ